MTTLMNIIMDIKTLLPRVRINSEVVITNLQAFNGYEDFILIFEGSLSVIVAMIATKVCKGYKSYKNKRFGVNNLKIPLAQSKTFC